LANGGKNRIYLQLKNYELVLAAICNDGQTLTVTHNDGQALPAYRSEIVLKQGIFLQNELEFSIFLKFLLETERSPVSLHSIALKTSLATKSPESRQT
jgi:hypothetical protein